MWKSLLTALVLSPLLSKDASNALAMTRNVQIPQRTFTVDLRKNVFLKDGQPFRYVSGSLHYFRVPHQYWRDRLRKFRVAGLNAVDTYVEWSLHNPMPNIYTWEGDANLVKFIEMAAEEDLLVILRPGPYICAERDLGGHPFWLLSQYYGNESSKIKPRTTDPRYLQEVRKWYAVLMNKMRPLLYGNGGPIIMVQVENEYGSFGCDRVYKNWMRDETKQYTGDAALLFTTDGGWDSPASCGKIEGVYLTVDFGTSANVSYAWRTMRKMQPHGPYVNSEFYPGWLSHWNEKMERVGTEEIIDTFRQMMDSSASVNFYVFYGGTNFGFTSGANYQLKSGTQYQPQLTSYDYDAPLDEAGDPTLKYFALRNVISEYLPLPDIPVPIVKPKGSYGRVAVTPAVSLLSPGNILASDPVLSVNPQTFEELWQFSGFVLYTTTLPTTQNEKLAITKLHDRAHVYIDNVLAGILYRNNDTSIKIDANEGSKLQILVENLGRINFGEITNEYKGIVGSVKWGDQKLTNWESTGFPLDNVKEISSSPLEEEVLVQTTGTLINGPVVYSAKFDITGEILDTYLDTTGWGKGVIWINNYNLGRYWPSAGPQMTLYVPAVYLKQNNNEVKILELETAREDLSVNFSDTAILG